MTGVLLAAGTLFAVLLIADHQQRPSLSTISFQSPLTDAFPTSAIEAFPAMELFEGPISTPVRFPDISNIQLADAIRPVQNSGLVAPFFGFMWSPNSDSVIYAQLTDQVIVYEPNRGFAPVTELRLQELKSGGKSLITPNGRFPKWAPSGNRILYVSWFNANQSYIMLSDLATGETSRLLENGVFAEWLSDDEIVTVDTEGKVKSFKLDSSSDDKSLDIELTVSTNGPNSIVVSPDRQRIALVNEKQLSIFDLESRQLTPITKDEFTDIIGGLAWSPQSDRLAYVSNKSIRITTIGETVVTNALNVQETTGFPSSLSWCPDGGLLVYQAFDGIWIVDADSGERKLLIENTLDSESIFSTPMWSPDGKVIAFESNGNIVTTMVFQAPSPLLTPTEAKGIWDSIQSPLPTPVTEQQFDALQTAMNAAHRYLSENSQNDEPHVILHRKIELKEFPELGFGEVTLGSEPPMELIVLKGNFDANKLGLGAALQFDGARYLVLVFDLDSRSAIVTRLSASEEEMAPLLKLQNEAK
jgi:Tol biopolymer transport system component